MVKPHLTSYVKLPDSVLDWRLHQVEAAGVAHKLDSSCCSTPYSAWGYGWSGILHPCPRWTTSIPPIHLLE